MPVGSGGNAGIRKALREELANSTLKIAKEWRNFNLAGVGITEITSVIVFKGKLYVVLGGDNPGVTMDTGLGIYRFDGEDWEYVLPFRNGWWWGHAVFNNKLYFVGAGNLPDGTLITLMSSASGDLGSWSTANPFNMEVMSLAVYGGQLYAGSDVLFRSNDGVTWTNIWAGAPNALALEVYNNLLFINTRFPGIPGGMDIGNTDLYSYNGAVFTNLVTIQERPGQDCHAVMRRVNTGARVNDLRLYYGGSGGTLYEYDGTTWVGLRVVNETIIRLMPVGGLLLIACGTFTGPTVTDGQMWIENRCAGSLWAYDGYGDLWKMCQLPGLAMAVERFAGKIYLGSGRIENGADILYSIDPYALTLSKHYPPKSMYFSDSGSVTVGNRDHLWNGLAIGINEYTYPIPCKGYGNKTVYFLSNTNGTLTIEVDPTGNGDWHTYTPETIVANIFDPISITGKACFIRLTFSVAATVSAWINLEN